MSTGNLRSGEAPIRILHVLGVLNMGGAESRIMDLYRHIDRTKVQFDFLVHTEASPASLPEGGEAPSSGVPTSEQLMAARKPDFYDEEVLSLGGRIYALPRYRMKTAAGYREAVRQFFSSHGGWAAVEGHMTSLAAIYLPAAKESGIPHTIAHVRSGGVPAGMKGYATKWMRRKLPERADILLSCARDAGLAVYGKRAAADGRIKVVPNAIDTGFFAFSAENRACVRRELGIPEDAVLIGHVGRFDPMKNHRFLIEVLKLLSGGQNAAGSPESPKAMLLLVGAGDLLEETRKSAESAGVADRVIFAGQCGRERTAALYQAMDVFCLPSLYEGLPGTVVEAQASGLPCLVSGRVTAEVLMTPGAEHLPIEDPAVWADRIRRMKPLPGREELSGEYRELLKKEGYDIREQAERMLSFYLGLDRKKLLLVSPMLHQGGFERICVRTAGLLAPHAEVTTAIFDDADIAYDISGLNIVNLNLPARDSAPGKAVNLARRILALRALKKRLGTDVTYSFGQTANLVNCNAGTGDRVICGLRSYLDFDNPEKIRMFCRKAGLIACCSRGMEERIREEYHCSRTFTLWNPVNVPEDGGAGYDRKDGLDEFIASHGQLVMSMGRQDDVKGFWHLIKAFSLLCGQRDEEELPPGLIIMGDGDWEEYRELSRKLGISEHAFFPGVMKAPFPLLKKASMYVLSSIHEGFPNALVEAMALGVPVIAADCTTGPAEILSVPEGFSEEERPGVLIPPLSGEKDLTENIPEEDRELARRMAGLIGDSAYAAALSARGRARAAEFSDEAYVLNCRKYFGL